jgi:3-hydroxy-9,10-secoandrosta-1,3,5(10)-triene-9,17-dione monooxygenase reductase component
MHQNAYRKAIAHFTTGVAVITSQRQGQRVGMTASAVASVSLDPVLLLVCISRHLPTREAVDEHGFFGVNVLGEQDEELARRFARPAADKFQGLEVIDDPASGVPLLSRAIARFSCQVDKRVESGDHTVFFGEVRHCWSAVGARPLVYYRTGFERLSADEDYLDRVAPGL